MNIFYKISNKIAKYILDSPSSRFITHNKSLWKNNSGDNKDVGEVLFELNEMSSAIIAYSYLANALADKHNSKIVAFSESRRKWFDLLVENLVNSNVKKIFHSFNTDKFVYIDRTKKQKEEADSIVNSVFPSFKTKYDVENLTIDGVVIGDLVYDTYLRSENLPTITLGDERFTASLKNSIEHYVFWRDYFNSHNVNAVSISHCVYNFAIPLRIAVSKNIPVYQISATHVYRLCADNLHAYNDFKYFPMYFKNLPSDVQEAGLKEGKLRLERRFSGEVGVDMAYSKKSAYSGIKEESVLKKNDRIKVLIATHCFFDSPHPYGNNLFPDFYEWISFLGEISDKTNYDWYIKTHPDFLPGNKYIIDEFIDKFPRFNLIPAETSHKQIIEEGIDYALTVYGTIGFEYAALGIPVINASLNNPHVAYNFNIHPKTIKEYEDILLSLGGFDFSINRDEVYEYYFMKFIYNTKDWLFDDYSAMEKSVGGYSKQFTSKVYTEWLREWAEEKHVSILNELECFIESGDFRLINTREKQLPNLSEGQKL